MALVLARLKLASQLRVFGSGGTAARVGFIATWLIALALGIGAGRAIGALSVKGTAGADLLAVLIPTLVLLGWATVPVFLPATADQVADPARLEQFPISAQDQVLGILLGGLIAPTAMFTFLLASGGTLLDGATIGVRLVTVAGAAIFTILCVTASRTIQAVLAGAVNTRRGKDVVVLASAGVAIAIYLLSQSFDTIVAALETGDVGGVTTLLSWLPTGAAGGAHLAARDGDWAGAMVRLVIVAATVLVLVVVWIGAIRGRVDGKGGASGSRASKATVSGLRLITSPLGAVAPSVVTATASQQLRYFFFRSSKALQSMTIGIVFAALVTLGLPADASTMAGATAGMLLVTLTALNMFAFDGAGFAYLVQAGAPWRQVMAGKALGWLVVLVGGVTAITIAGAVIHGTLGELPATWLTGMTVGLVGIGLGALTSILGPSSSVDSGGKPGPGSKIAFGVGLFVMFAVMVGVALGASILGAALGPFAVAVALFVIAAVIAIVLVRLAGTLLERDPYRIDRALNG